jgi:hypothetical protein
MMSRKFFIPVLIILFFSILSSCRSAKKIQNAVSTIKKDVPKDTTIATTDNAHEDSVAFIKETYQQILKRKIDFTTFSAKINVDYVGGDDKEQKVNAFIRMYKDSVIWVSINATFLGIEVMRAYITKDSIKMLDKANKLYTARSVAYLQEVTELPLDMQTLQELIIGNPIFLDSNIVSYSSTPNSVSLFSIGDKFKNLITVNDGDKVITHCKLDDADAGRNRTCDLNYTDYNNNNGINFSTGRNVTIAEKSKLNIWLEFKQYNFNETLSFPFSIPKGYKPN